MTGNIAYDWLPVYEAGSPWGIYNPTFANNQPQDDHPAFSEPAGDYVDPDRSIGSYHGTLGRTATLDAFLDEARKQSRSFWRSEYKAVSVNAYIRAGFETP